MMTATALPYYVLPPETPTVVVLLMAAAAVAAWWALHRWPVWRTTPARRVASFSVRAGVGFAALMAVTQVLLRGLVLVTSWPIWPVAMVGAIAVELVLALYALERRTVSKRTGLALASLRIAVILLVLAMLIQPVHSLELSQRLERYVAVLVDDSSSMHLAQRQLTASEKVRIAEMLSEVRRPHRFEVVHRELTALHADLAAQADWLATVAKAEEAERQRQLDGRRESLHEAFSDALEALEAPEKALAAAMGEKGAVPDETRSEVADVKARLAVQVRQRLGDAVAWTERKASGELARRGESLLSAVQVAAATVAESLPKIRALGEKLDDAFYGALSAADRGRVDVIAQRTRYELARDVLLHRPSEEGETRPSFLADLQDTYRVKLYTFASEATETSASSLAESPAATQPTTAPTTQPDGRARTDLAAALEKVRRDFPARQLAGVIVLTDGRHNGAEGLETLARQFGTQRVPICPVVLGGSRAPRDAAIVALQAPETVFEKTNMYVTAELKLDGLAGKSVRVTLYDGEKSVDFRSVRVPSETFRTRIQLADEPKSVGLHSYRVELETFDDEVFEANNTYPLTVSVTDEPTRVLLVEGRPRWEFRYLKNLFTGRDRSVALQYVLFEPDRIEGAEPRKRIHASASGANKSDEATDLPADEAEWMKFDVIVLGDVAPAHLTPAHLEAVQKFVTDRGGALVLIAGPRYMPHAFAETAMDELAPATFASAPRVMTGGTDAFRIALTSAGRESVIMRQKVDAEENLALWRSIPEAYWRHPTVEAKPAATVLACAVGGDVPAFMKPDGEAALEEVAALRRQYERRNALIMHHTVSWGRVLMLSFDRTWRLRYRVGDTHHHKFWGQVLRWATSEKLPAGTPLVRIGTDRPRYQPEERVRVRAKIVREDLSPLISDEVAVKILDGDKVVLRKKLQYVRDSAGMYEADLGVLPSATYQAELDAPVAKRLLARDNREKVATEFSVDPATSIEQIELTPDRGLLGRLAGLTGGQVSDPPEARRLLGALGESELVLSQRRQVEIWNSWPLLVMMILLVTAEWLLRKKEGLA